MGNCIQNVSARASLVARGDTWIESDAIQQLIKTSELSGVIRAVGMPDLHPGRGYPIGAAFLSEGYIYPALVGNDIGCGMAVWSTDLAVHKIKLDKLEKQLGNIDQPLGDDWQEMVRKRQQDKQVMPGVFDSALGTIGGGNHFAELQMVDEVYMPEQLAAVNLSVKHLCLLVHSGSRGLGEQILRQHVDKYSHKGLDVGSDAFHEYVERHNHALRFAELNREFIARRLLSNLKTRGEMVLDVNHNLVEPYSLGSGWVHRKGATPAEQGMVMIPGSRGDYSYLVQARPSDTSLCSLAHGTGRKWIRSGCKARLSCKYTVEQMKRTELGGRVICGSRELMYEEAPQAYKSIDNVISAMSEAGLIDIVARFRPVLTYKTRGTQG
ncbi:Protein RtcB [Photobacterium marinum]|uniref:3'-phosphate/5'-hydroxy nucleic acid ligase n=1 Tax=Photobacterium marinum TaxID=1056511 RepID=L8J8C5_9GAMM|nr:RNA ligase RtcB family protein [Photobacterium marinum]ELR64443.1 Protein RtcB [Photobacterium marinum]